MTGRVIVITSGKGGVGKTTTSANIGTALAKEGYKVVLIDTDLGLRNLDLLLGLENRIVYTIVDVIEDRCKLKQALVKDKKNPNLSLLAAAQTRDKSAVSAEQLKDICEKLKEENRKLKDEVWKDKKLQDMKEQLDKMKSDYNRGFNITEEEETAIKEWKKKHEEDVHGLMTPMARLKAQGASGGRYSYIFYPTAIGCSGVIRCDACGEEFEFYEIG